MSYDWENFITELSDLSSTQKKAGENLDGVIYINRNYSLVDQEKLSGLRAKFRSNIKTTKDKYSELSSFLLFMGKTVIPTLLDNNNQKVEEQNSVTAQKEVIPSL